jgi:thioredoxin
MVEKKYIKYAAAAFVLYLAIHYWGMIANAIGMLLGAVFPLFIGLIIAYIINILMSFYEQHYFTRVNKKWVQKSRRVVCIILAIFTFAAILALIVIIVLPELISSIELLLQEVPAMLSNAYNWVIDNEAVKPFLDPDILNAKIDWQDTVKKVIDFVISGAGGVMNSAISIASSVFSVITQAVIGFIFALYLLLEKEKLLFQVNKLMTVYVKKKIRNKINYVAKIANETFHSFIVGQCTEAFILGGLCALGMLIFRFPYAGMTGAVVGITALIPVAGAYIGAGVGAFMICTVSPMKAVLFIVYIIILQQLENNLIYPKVVGSSIGLPGIWVLAAVTIGGSIMGVTGMLFGVPGTAVIYKLLREDMNEKYYKKDKCKKQVHEKIICKGENKMAVENVKLADFEEKVLKNAGLVLVDFYADWCGPCKMMSPIVDSAAQEVSNLTVYKVNVDEETALAARYKVMSIPTLILFKNGEAVKTSVGLISKEELNDLLKM